MAAPSTSPATRDETGPPVTIGRPIPADAEACWELVQATGVLDVNSRYAYALWFRDFADTSVVARIDGEIVGFVSGYRRPDDPATLMVWQVAVDAAARGRGLAGSMLDALFAGTPGVDHLETTITPDNDSSIALFTGFAGRHTADVRRSELFGTDALGAGHLPEMLFRIGPISEDDK